MNRAGLAVRERSGEFSAMQRTSRRTATFTESLIREMTRVAQQHNAINLSQGFPDFNPPREILEAAKSEMDSDHHQYAITWGALPLRQALARKLSHFTGLPCNPDRHLIVTCGATEAMMVAVMTVADVGDRIGLFSPFYENYSADAILSGVTPVFATLHAPDYTFDPAELRGIFASGIKAFILCNPSNPTGKVFTRDELGQIATLAQEFDVFVITDEVYEHIVFPPHQHTYIASLPGMAERTIQCSSLSKTFAITGWRIGYIFANPSFVAQGRKVHDFLTVGAAAPLQHAIVAGLQMPFSYYAGLARDYAARRDVLLGYLNQTGLRYTPPQGAYFVMLDISSFGYANDVEFARWMTKEIGVAPVPGSVFFQEPEHRYVRLNFAKRAETLHAAGERLLRLRRG
jgi:aspartate/methionine/tyrosine aminotransferase